MQYPKELAMLGVLLLSSHLHAADNAPAKKTSIKTDKTTSIPPVPAQVGYDIFKEVKELHENVEELVDALSDASGTYGYADLKAQQSSFRNLKQRLDEIDRRLTTKEDLASNNEFLEYFAKPEFSVTVHDALRELGLILNTIAQGMEGGTKTTVKMPYRVADHVVDQVLEVRESVDQLVSAISTSGRLVTFYNWAHDEKKLNQYMTQLKQMEERLERKEAAADAEWTGWFGADVYKVTVHDSIADLGNIVSSLATSLSGRQPKSSH
jgi:hypothetical protein